eukprot:3922445-Pyramimonas_sp.AAC.1
MAGTCPMCPWEPPLTAGICSSLLRLVQTLPPLLLTLSVTKGARVTPTGPPFRIASPKDLRLTRRDFGCGAQVSLLHEQQPGPVGARERPLRESRRSEG